MFENFHGNSTIAQVLFGMARQGRIPQTILLDGAEGVGKATLARRFAATLLGDARKIEQDDLILESNAAIIADREKWPSDKRNDDPLMFSTHPDFITFPPDGPLRQITIEQMRMLKERAQFKPLHGSRRVFLIDHIDRANEQAANSLLKTLEEPPDHLILILTAENPYDLLPTIRSRAVFFHLGPLSTGEMQAFAAERGLSDSERRIALAAGSPGLAIAMDLDVYEQRRSAMLKLLQAAAGTCWRRSISDWLWSVKNCSTPWVAHRRSDWWRQSPSWPCPSTGGTPVALFHAHLTEVWASLTLTAGATDSPSAIFCRLSCLFLLLTIVS